MAVNRCVCHDVSFAKLIKLAEVDGLTIDEMADRTGATTGCGTCMPYLRLALATRCPELPVMTSGQLNEAIRAAEAKRGADASTADTPRWTFNHVDHDR